MQTSSAPKVAKPAHNGDRCSPSIHVGASEQAWDVAPPAVEPQSTGPIDVLVFGSLASDLICDYDPLNGSNDGTSPAPYTSNPAIIAQSAGGVGYNIALAAKYAGASVLLSSVVADDLAGRFLLDHLVSLLCCM